MKRLAILLLLILAVMSIADDLKTKQPVNNNSNRIQALQEHRVEPGETVLSIAEQIHDGHLPNRDISQLLEDFSRYNSNTDPYALVSGRTYYFPIYVNK